MLLIAVLIEIVFRAADALSIATVVLLSCALVTLTAAELWFARTRRAATSDAVRQSAGLTLTHRESARLLTAIEAVTSHFTGRDVREPPPEIELALAQHPGVRLRLEHRPKPPHYAVVVISGG